MTLAPQPLTSTAELEMVLARSFTRPVVIFKHSSTCGRSAMAEEEISQLVAGTPVEADVFTVHVQAHRQVSNAIADALHVRHESPQVLLISQGTAVWHGSHLRVTERAIRQALQQLESARSDRAAPAAARSTDGG
jgi:monothiol bacilliredoxin